MGIGRRGAPGGTHTHLPLQLCLRVILVGFSRWWRLRRRRPWRTADGLGRLQEVVVRRASAAAGWLLVECQGRAHKEAKGQAKPGSTQPRGHARAAQPRGKCPREGGKPRNEPENHLCRQWSRSSTGTYKVDTRWVLSSQRVLKRSPATVNGLQVQIVSALLRPTCRCASDLGRRLGTRLPQGASPLQV